MYDEYKTIFTEHRTGTRVRSVSRCSGVFVMQSTPLDISKRRRKKYCDWLITIYRGDGVGGDGTGPLPGGKNLYPAGLSTT